MIQDPNQIFVRPISIAEMQMLRRKAQSAMIGGKSNIREKSDRADHLEEDQLVGMIGHYAWSVVHFGTSQHFLNQRWISDKNKYQGDLGDIIGANIDVKSSRLNHSRPILKHSLVVRAREYREDVIYVLVLVDIVNEPNRLSQAHLVGWIEGSRMPPQPNESGIFEGAYSTEASNLNPVMPIRWYW